MKLNLINPRCNKKRIRQRNRREGKIRKKRRHFKRFFFLLKTHFVTVLKLNDSYEEYACIKYHDGASHRFKYDFDMT